LFAQISTPLPGSCPGGVGLTTALVALAVGLGDRWQLADCGRQCSDRTSRLPHCIERARQGRRDDFGKSHQRPVGYDGGNNGDDDGNDGNNAERPREISRVVIASGFEERTDPAALVIGPTGVGLSRDGALYVADSLKDRIVKITDALFRNTSAGTGIVVSAGGHISDPLGLAIAPNGNILITNGGDGNLVETTPDGVQVEVKPVDTTGAGGGTLFGLAVAPGQAGIYFVNDGNNTLNLLH